MVEEPAEPDRLPAEASKRSEAAPGSGRGHHAGSTGAYRRAAGNRAGRRPGVPRAAGPGACAGRAGRRIRRRHPRSHRELVQGSRCRPGPVADPADRRAGARAGRGRTYSRAARGSRCSSRRRPRWPGPFQRRARRTPAHRRRAPRWRLRRVRPAHRVAKPATRATPKRATAKVETAKRERRRPRRAAHRSRRSRPSCAAGAADRRADQ